MLACLVLVGLPVSLLACLVLVGLPVSQCMWKGSHYTSEGLTTGKKWYGAYIKYVEYQYTVIPTLSP
jgi:hypothetical protein